MQQTQRPWVSLWLTIHLVIVALCLLNNRSSSQLVSRMARAVSPYAVALHQDYGGIPLAMTSSDELDQQVHVEVHLANDPAGQWQTISPTAYSTAHLVDSRATNFQRMLAIVGQDKNEEVLNLLFDQAILAASQPVDAVRLRRVAAYSYEQANLKATGELPPGAVEDSTIFQCQVITLPSGQHRLLPVLDKVRRASAVEAAK